MGTKEEEVEIGVRHVPPDEGRSLWVLGELVTYKTTSEQTGGAYSLFEVTTQPEVGPPPHVQHREDEAFYVLEGEYEFLDDDGRTTRVGTGSLVYVPKGALHTHKNIDDKPGRMLVSQTPGGLHERFFEELGELATDESRLISEGSVDIEKIAVIAAEYGIEIPLISDR